MELEGGSEMAFREGEMFRYCWWAGFDAAQCSHNKFENIPRRGEREEILSFFYVFIYTWQKSTSTTIETEYIIIRRELLKKLLRSRFKCF